MSNTFEQGWAAKPFKEQFPELSEKEAERLDRLNMSITDMLLAGLITDSQSAAIRQKRFPKLVGEVVMTARKRDAAAEKEYLAGHSKGGIGV